MALSAEELRIGNWVELEGLNSSLNRTTLTAILQGRYNELNPIPLTQEILLKCGFEKIPHFTVMNSLIFKLGRNRELSLGCVGTPNEMLFLNEVDDENNPSKVTDCVCLHNFDYDGKLYLHKLQNIIAIFGQELDCTQIL